MLMMLTLYNTPHSTCSQKVRFCLAEKKFEWIDVHIDLANNEHLSPKYLLINDNGVVPTLVHDENIIKDSNGICEDTDGVFSELANGQSLTPEDPIKKLKCAHGCDLLRKFQPLLCEFHHSIWHFCLASKNCH